MRHVPIRRAQAQAHSATLSNSPTARSNSPIQLPVNIRQLPCYSVLNDPGASPNTAARSPMNALLAAPPRRSNHFQDQFLAIHRRADTHSHFLCISRPLVNSWTKCGTDGTFLETQGQKERFRRCERSPSDRSSAASSQSSCTTPRNAPPCQSRQDQRRGISHVNCQILG